jgi:restriction endonuclease S subunit
LKTILDHIAILSTGIYAQPDSLTDTLYLQSNHFSETGSFDLTVKPQIKISDKHQKHLLQNDDVLFAAKGLNNFAVCYHNSIGQAVASSSFIIIRVSPNFKKLIIPEYLAWYINNSKQVTIFHKTKATTTIPSISIAQLSQLEIDIPEKAVQESIVEIQRLRDKEKQTIKRLTFLKDKLTQQTLLKASKK